MTVAGIVRKYIQVRGRTPKEVSVELKMPYTTFMGKLKRDAIDVPLLFELNNLLDMDLNWMSSILDHKTNISSLEPFQIPRMNNKLRMHDRPAVEKNIKKCIKENPTSIASARNAILSEYNTYYLLDILLPENINIFVTRERMKEKYYCIRNIEKKITGRRLCSSIDGREMIEQLIAERKNL